MSCPFTILRARPDRIRGESINVGIVAFADDGLVVRVDTDMARLRAFDANLSALPVLQNLAAEIERIVAPLPDRSMQLAMLRDFFAPVHADETLGVLAADRREEAVAAVEQLMTRLVARPARSIKEPGRIAQAKTSKLNTQLRDWFKASKIYSRNVADLSRHRVVPNFPVAASNDLYAEFALMNGVVHVIETLDFRGHDKMTATVQKDAAIKSIILDQAKRHLDPDSKKIAVVSASNYGAMRPAIGIVTAYADDVIAMASNDDRQRLANFIATSLHQQNLPLLSG